MRHRWSEGCSLDKIERLARIHDALAFTLDLHMDKWDIRHPWEYYGDEPYSRPSNNPSPAYMDWFIHPVMSPEERSENRRNLAAVTHAL